MGRLHSPLSPPCVVGPLGLSNQLSDLPLGKRHHGRENQRKALSLAQRGSLRLVPLFLNFLVINEHRRLASLSKNARPLMSAVKQTVFESPHRNGSLGIQSYDYGTLHHSGELGF